MSLESVEQEWTAGADRLCTRMYTRVHARRTIMRFRAAAAAVDHRRPIAPRRCVCVCAYTGSFFLPIALLLHGTSGHVPLVTHPRPSPVHPVTEPPTLDTPESTPVRPTLVTSATSFFVRLHVLSVLFGISHRSLVADVTRAYVTLIKTYLPSPNMSRMKTPTFHMSFALVYYIFTNDIVRYQ